LLHLTYAFFGLHLVLFGIGFTSFSVEALQRGWLRLIPTAFYLWVGVFNLFAVSLFWSSMADQFSSQDSKRNFGWIGAGGSLGQMAGSVLAERLAPIIGPNHLFWVSLVLLTISLLAAAPLKAAAPEERPNSLWSGITTVMKSRYLMGICFYIFLYTFTTSFLYFEKQTLVASAVGGRAERVVFFARLNFASSLATVLVQLLVTGKLMLSLGLAVALAVTPLATVMGFVVLAWLPVLTCVAFFEVVRKTLNYAISRPSREVLFTVVPREQKYLAKNFIDTFVYRAGDALASVAFELLRSLQLGVSGLALAAVPFSLLWMVTGVALGRAQFRAEKHTQG